MEVSQKPWKIVKYMFNTKVMSVLKVQQLCFARIAEGLLPAARSQPFWSSCQVV